MPVHNILSLGAGVQSTTLYLLALDGELDGVRFDAAVFADTQEEPQDVYRHLDWLRSLGGPPIVTVTAGKLGDGNVVNRGLDQKLYVHRSCRPLDEANLDDAQTTLFDMECEGGCGL